MIVVEGKSIYTEPYELVDPTHTALVLVDMQKDFAEPDGAAERVDRADPAGR